VKAVFVLARLGILAFEFLACAMLSNMVAATIGRIALFEAQHNVEKAMNRTSDLGSYIFALLVMGVVTAMSMIFLARDVHKGNLERTAAGQLMHEE
jgi:hypothetical protein